MSYILDALRRADSDRERGVVPSLHSNVGSEGIVDADESDAGVRSVQPLWWAVGGLSLALLAMMAWLVFGRSAPQAEPAPAIAAVPIGVTPTPVAPQVAPAPMPVTPVLPPPVAMDQPPERGGATQPVPRTAAVKPAKPASPAPAPVVAKPNADADAPVPSISELPDDIRRQLPSLSVSGASYSKNPGSRMLILNGQVFREGDKVANDLVLEQIRLKSAVLSFRGRRYSINF